MLTQRLRERGLLVLGLEVVVPGLVEAVRERDPLGPDLRRAFQEVAALVELEDAHAAHEWPGDGSEQQDYATRQRWKGVDVRGPRDGSKGTP